MNTADRLRRCTRIAVALLLGPGATAAWCQSAAADARIPGAWDLSKVGKIGRMPDSIRRTRSGESLYADIAGGYADYTNYLFAQSATQTYLNEGLGSAKYSFSYFDTPDLPPRAASRNWSINAVQN